MPAARPGSTTLASWCCSPTRTGRPGTAARSTRARRWSRSPSDGRQADPAPTPLQAAIAAVHASAPTWGATDWGEVVGLYDHLLAVLPTPIVALNRAVAIAERDGPAAGLDVVEAIADLERFHLWHAARADLLRRLGRVDDAAAAYRAAAGLRTDCPGTALPAAPPRRAALGRPPAASPRPPASSQP